MSPIGHTKRGLADYAAFTDTYETAVRVRQSSAAMVDAVWIFVGDNAGVQLDVARAEVLVAALQEWIADASR